MEHRFLFFPGTWLGEGTIRFSSSPEVLHFYTSWEGGMDPVWQWIQRVQISGNEEEMVNVYRICLFVDGCFSLLLENALLGEVEGEGRVREQEIEWKYEKPGHLIGYESYRLQENGEYWFVAEYHTEEIFQTRIEGRIWEKTGA